MSVSSATGTYRGQSASRDVIIELPAVGRIHSAEAEGAVKHSYDRASGLQRFDLGPRDIRQALTLRVRAP